jgi:hypothetical protein
MRKTPMDDRKEDATREREARRRREPAFIGTDGKLLVVCYCFGSPCCCTEVGFDMSGLVPDPYIPRGQQ